MKPQKRFPKMSPTNPAPKVPLKIGIFKDLVPRVQKLGLAGSVLRDAIRTWYRGTRYWTGGGTPQVDLAGQEAGHVLLADANRVQGQQAQRAARYRSPRWRRNPTDLYFGGARACICAGEVPRRSAIRHHIPALHDLNQWLPVELPAAATTADTVARPGLPAPGLAVRASRAHGGWSSEVAPARKHVAQIDPHHLV